MLKRISIWALFVFCLCLFFTTELEARGKRPPFRERTPCKVPERSWFDAEYLYWNFKDAPVAVPLVVEGPIPSSNVVLGEKGIKNDWLSGGKLAFGYWFDNSRQLGGEASYLIIPGGSKAKTVRSDGSPNSAVLSAPYFDVNTEAERFAVIASPGNYEGTAKLKLSNCLQSAEMIVVARVPHDCSSVLVLLAGLRYWGFNEDLSFETNSPNIPSFPANVYQTTDKFEAENHFYGGQIGARFEYICDRFLASIQTKVAFGTMHQKSVIKGELLTNDFNGFGAVEKFPGGYFTMPSNIKTRKTECYAIIPEANITFGFQATDTLSFKLGYTVIYVNNVFRPGNEINRKINPTQSANLSDTPEPILIGPAKPKSSLKSSNFYAQGLNAGFEFSF